MEQGKKSKFIMALLMMFLPVFVFATTTDDAFIMPFHDLIVAWMTGNVGLTIAIVIMVISVIWGAFGGGFGIIGKGFIFSILVGGIVFFAEKAYDMGGSFS